MNTGWGLVVALISALVIIPIPLWLALRSLTGESLAQEARWVRWYCRAARSGPKPDLPLWGGPPLIWLGTSALLAVIGVLVAIGVLHPMLFVVPFFVHWAMGEASKRRARTRLKARVRATGYRLCLSCQYDLRGLDSIGSCPECGAEYEITSTQSQWRELLDERE